MKTVWLLLDDRIGSVGQAKGVAQALNDKKYKIVEKKITYNRFAKLPNFLKGASLIGVSAESKKHLKTQAPDLVISASRRTSTIARWIKNKSNGKTKIVQITHSGKCGLSSFDAVFVPEHDRHKKTSNNIFYITGAPHRITNKSLKEAQNLWGKEFASLPKPLTAVIVGGAIKDAPFTLDNAVSFAHEIKGFKDKIGGSVLLTTSRRTGSDPEKVIVNALKGFPSYNYLWGNTGVNPFMGFLACADNVIVTGDSVSMCSEACGTGKPVFVFTGQNWLTKKHHRFVASLFEGGFATSLSSQNSEFKPKSSLNAAKDIAVKIDSLFK